MMNGIPSGETVKSSILQIVRRRQLDWKNVITYTLGRQFSSVWFSAEVSGGLKSYTNHCVKR